MVLLAMVRQESENGSMIDRFEPKKDAFPRIEVFVQARIKGLWGPMVIRPSYLKNLKKG